MSSSPFTAMTVHWVAESQAIAATDVVPIPTAAGAAGGGVCGSNVTSPPS